ncbi:MOSC domain-containing protein [Thalassoglobus polymorphus]|uniref:MOSC domain protein n=1 Tax=Thalassoglobus polymorphus TaxID=2527994 RepID=A0A517QUF9_9PLAN|nr:MOSC domain-containing protein [Thalassoglobus polymorphus]QDT35217.1 MOSC domain protein [Thalassoglobus polymorphus]
MLHQLLQTVPQVGKLEWIGLSSRSQSVIQPVKQVEVRVDTGLVGDYHSEHKPGGERQVSMFQYEHLAVVAQFLSNREVKPELLRRNLVVSGINLASLKKHRFRIGDVIFEGAGECAPCSRMEKNLGEGGFQAMRGHGGLISRVVSGGTIHVGDEVVFIGEKAESD